MILYKQFTFSSAHKLDNYNDKDANIHGHTYTLSVGLKGDLQANGIVYDLDKIQTIVKENVLNYIDHSYLNETILQPTVENVTIWIWRKLSDKMPLHEIKLEETPTVFAVYHGEHEI